MPIIFGAEAKLFLLIFFLRGFDAAVVRGLGLGFFHGFLSFGGLLSPDFSALLALFIQNLLAAQQFEKSLVCAVPFIPGGADDAGVSAVAVAETGAYGVEQLHHGFVGHQVRGGEAARREIAPLAERDHFLDERARRFGFRNGRFDALLDNDGGDQVTEQRTPMRRVPSEFVSCNFVTHENLSDQWPVVSGQYSVNTSRSGG